jgi:hypothetical protein
MQKIEHTVREYDAAALTLAPLRQRLPRHHFPPRVDVAQYVHSACGENRMSRTIRGISTRS